MSDNIQLTFPCSLSCFWAGDTFSLIFNHSWIKRSFMIDEVVVVDDDDDVVVDDDDVVVVVDDDDDVVVVVDDDDDVVVVVVDDDDVVVVVVDDDGMNNGKGEEERKYDWNLSRLFDIFLFPSLSCSPCSSCSPGIPFSNSLSETFTIFISWVSSVVIDNGRGESEWERGEIPSKVAGRRRWWCRCLGRDDDERSELSSIDITRLLREERVATKGSLSATW